MLFLSFVMYDLVYIVSCVIQYNDTESTLLIYNFMESYIMQKQWRLHYDKFFSDRWRWWRWWCFHMFSWIVYLKNGVIFVFLSFSCYHCCSILSSDILRKDRPRISNGNSTMKKISGKFRCLGKCIMQLLNVNEKSSYLCHAQMILYVYQYFHHLLRD